VQRAYAVGKVGVVRLTFPTNWADGIRQIKGPEKTLDMIQFLPVNGESFEALIHIEYIGKEAAEKILPRMKLAQIGKDELTHSVETSLALQDFKGAGGAGCYFIVTDKSFSMLEEPPKGQYRYLMEGYTQIDGLAIVFWLTSNHIANQQAAVLSMIESAEFKTNAVGQSEPPH
jgi:hypothetical protein